LEDSEDLLSAFLRFRSHIPFIASMEAEKTASQQDTRNTRKLLPVFVQFVFFPVFDCSSNLRDRIAGWRNG
jgi:hypothetical protein